MSQGISTVGQDSFLDIVANLVGVLIILVVIVGAQTASQWESRSVAAESSMTAIVSEIQSLKLQASDAADEVHKLEIDNDALERKIADEASITAIETQRRHAMLMQLEIARGEIERRKLELNDDQQQRVERQQQRATLVAEIEDLNRKISAVRPTMVQPPVGTINHYPNPIARTVFMKEVHFQLSGGRIVPVPMDDLIDRMKASWRTDYQQRVQDGLLQDTVGPIGNFRLHYELASEVIPASRGRSGGQRVSLRQFELLPVDLVAGQPVADAIADPQSTLQKILGRFEPGKTTVSVWVYPDSFAEHSQLKEWLHENDFQLASWPLSEGRRISGGPNGFRTSAQ